MLINCSIVAGTYVNAVFIHASHNDSAVYIHASHQDRFFSINVARDGPKMIWTWSHPPGGPSISNQSISYPSGQSNITRYHLIS